MLPPTRRRAPSSTPRRRSTDRQRARSRAGSFGRCRRGGVLRDDARKVLAWEDIADEENDLRLDDGQKRQLAESLKKAQRDIKETVWRTYKNVMLLGKDGEWKTVDPGTCPLERCTFDRASSSSSVWSRRAIIEDKGVSPNFLVRNWPPAFKEWSTKSAARRVLRITTVPALCSIPGSIKDTIARGVENGMLGYVGKKARRQLMRRSTGTARCPRRTSRSPTTSSHPREVARRTRWNGWLGTCGCRRNWGRRRYGASFLFGRVAGRPQLPALNNGSPGCHTGKHSPPRVDWRYHCKVDELLHEGALKVLQPWFEARFGGGRPPGVAAER